MKRLAVLGSLAIGTLTLSSLADPVPTPECEAWLQSLAPYGEAMDEAIGRGEIEDVYGQLERISRVYYPKGPTRDLDELEARCKTIRATLDPLTAPEELETLHQRIENYYGVVAISAARIREGSLETKPYALRAAIQALIDVYDRMLEDFLENGCENGDTEALRERVLPELRERLQSLEREIESP